MGFQDASLILRVRLIHLSVTLLVQILGVAIPFWYEGSGLIDHIGLWEVCMKIIGCVRVGSNIADWWKATQAFEIIGLLLVAASLGLVVFVMFIQTNTKLLKLIGSALSFAACGCIILGIIIYGAKMGPNNLSGAFAITIIAGVSCCVDGALAFVDWWGGLPFTRK